MKTTFITEGVNGSGKTIYLVVTEVDGRWVHTEKFFNKAEAERWLEYAC